MDPGLFGFDLPLFKHDPMSTPDDSDNSAKADAKVEVTLVKVADDLPKALPDSVVATRADENHLPNAYEFIIDLPGLKSGDIKVQVAEDDKVMVVTGGRRREEEKELVIRLRTQRPVGRFMRKFVLPEDAKTDTVSAVCQDGVLTVTVEKLPPPPPPQPNSPSEVELVPSPTVLFAQAFRDQLLTLIEERSLRRLRKFGQSLDVMKGICAPCFYGPVDPEVAYQWTEDMEFLFDALSVPKDNWVTIASIFLRGSADQWYKTEIEDNELVLDWSGFKRLLYNQKFPEIGGYQPRVGDRVRIELDDNVKWHIGKRKFKSFLDVFDQPVDVESLLLVKRQRSAP